MQLCVGQPVKQEVRNTPLTARTNDEVRIANGEARHLRVERFGRHVVRTDATRSDAAGKLAGCVGDLLAPAVRQCEGECHVAILRAVATQRVEHSTNERGQPPEISDRIETNALIEDFVSLRQQELPQKLHERINFFFGPRPVLLAEGVERERP